MLRVFVVQRENVPRETGATAGGHARAAPRTCTSPPPVLPGLCPEPKLTRSRRVRHNCMVMPSRWHLLAVIGLVLILALMASVARAMGENGSHGSDQHTHPTALAQHAPSTQETDAVVLTARMPWSSPQQFKPKQTKSLSHRVAIFSYRGGDAPRFCYTRPTLVADAARLVYALHPRPPSALLVA